MPSALTTGAAAASGTGEALPPKPVLAGGYVADDLARPDSLMGVPSCSMLLLCEDRRLPSGLPVAGSLGCGLGVPGVLSTCSAGTAHSHIGHHFKCMKL